MKRNLWLVWKSVAVVCLVLMLTGCPDETPDIQDPDDIVDVPDEGEEANPLVGKWMDIVYGITIYEYVPGTSIVSNAYHPVFNVWQFKEDGRCSWKKGFASPTVWTGAYSFQEDELEVTWDSGEVWGFLFEVRSGKLTIAYNDDPSFFPATIADAQHVIRDMEWDGYSKSALLEDSLGESYVKTEAYREAPPYQNAEEYWETEQYQY